MKVHLCASQYSLIDTGVWPTVAKKSYALLRRSERFFGDFASFFFLMDKTHIHRTYFLLIQSTVLLQQLIDEGIIEDIAVLTVRMREDCRLPSHILVH